MSKNITEYNRECLGEGSYLLYDIADYEDNGSYYPTLFNHDKLIANKELVKTIIDVVPFYIHETLDDVPMGGEDIDEFLFLPDSRDSGINDVPSKFHDSEFWSTWFRDAWGDEQNHLLLDVYNRMRYPFINENTYMNALSLLEEGESDIEFLSDEESEEYMKEVIEEKLQNIYSLLNYNMNSSDYLNDWADSLVNSGRLTRQEADREILVYKLQDVRNEVVRRKFAGSSSLYRMLLNSIDRRGTFCGATRVGRVTGNESYSDSRLMRSIYAPWHAEFDGVDDPNYGDNLRELWHEKGGIPLGLFEPLFYTDEGVLRKNRGADEISVDEPQGSLETSKVRKSYSLLRLDQILNSSSNDRHGIIYLNPRELLTEDAWDSTEPYAMDGGNSYTLRELLLETYGLDDSITYEDACETILHAVGEGQYNFGSSLEIIYADASLDSTTTATVGDGYRVANMLDITADVPLYHDNSIFRKLGAQYPYPMVGGHPVCMMDSSWIEHIRRLGVDKMRVSENVLYGAQVGSVLDLTGTSTYSFYWIDGNGNLEEDKFATSNDSWVSYTVYGNTKTTTNGSNSSSPFYGKNYSARCTTMASLDLSEIKVKLAENGVTPCRVNNTLTYLDSDDGILHNVTKVRAFARPLSGSMLLDPKGANGLDAPSDSLSQHLIQGVEAFNGTPRGDITVYDKGVGTEVSNEGVISCATTTIYPVDYVEQPFSSQNQLRERDGVVSGTLNVPMSAEDGSFSYSGDIGFNFDVDTDIDLASAYSVGGNIDTVAYKDADGNPTPKVRLMDTTKRSSSENFIETTFTAPYGNNYGEAEVDALLVKDASLNTAMSMFLDARNYYEEIMIPREAFSGTSSTMVGRYDGLRTLKEGEYYFTCKYPFKVLPLMDKDINSNAMGMNYANIYGAMRFRVVARGSLGLSLGENKANSQNYSDNLVGMFLNSTSALTNPSDNRTFPHRTIDIDLYVQDRVNGEWTWELVASNHVEDSSVVMLNADALDGSVVLKKPVPMFLARSYTSSFFTGTGASSTFDEVSIRVGRDEDIWAEESDDTYSFRLLGEKSYRFLFDYSANTTEIAFHEGFHTDGTDGVISAEEFKDYSRVVRIDGNDAQESDYIYSYIPMGWVESNATILKGRSGFAVDMSVSEGEVSYSWRTGTTNGYAFGNPYLKSDSNNILYQYEGVEKSAVDGSYVIPYMYDYTNHQVSCLPVSDRFSEEKVLSNHHIAKARGVSSAIATLRASLSGIVSSMSILSPRFTESGVIPPVVTHEDNDFVSCRTSNRTIPTVTSGITVTSMELFGNNMIASQSFTDPRWSWDGVVPVWDDVDTWRVPKNVWMFQGSSDGVTFTYGGDTYREIISNWEVAVCLHGSVTGVGVKFITLDGTEITGTLLKEAEEIGDGWYCWSRSFSDKQCSSISFTITGTGTIHATKFVARRRVKTSHSYGLGDCLLTSNILNTLLLPSHDMLLFRNRTDGWMTPLMVKSSIKGLNGGYYVMRGTVSQGLLVDGCHITKLKGSDTDWNLVKPWQIHLSYSDANGGKLSKYAIRQMPSGNKPIVGGSAHDILSDETFSHQSGSSSLSFSARVVNEDGNGGWNSIPTNCRIHTNRGSEDVIPQVSITNETFGGLSNCMDVVKRLNGQSNPVVVTNVQLMEEGTNGETVLYEFEYLPIIYDERDQHLSFNYVVVLKK